MQTPLLAHLRAICSRPYGFWLDSALAEGRRNRRSFWGEEPGLVLRSWGRRVEVQRCRGATHHFEGDPFETLRELLAERRGQPGAAVGYLGYELNRHVEALPHTAIDDLGLPECYLAFYDRVHAFDARCLAPAVPPPASTPSYAGLRSSLSRAAYDSALRRTLAYIRAGDVYQVNLTQRFQVTFSADPFDAYTALRAQSPAPFAAYLGGPGFAVLSSSPELFLRYQSETRLIETRPIKGTRPRGADAESDSALARELLASEKERAENLMIVDLERNDLGKVAEFGSVKVPGLFEVETYANVHHLTSTVQGRLREDKDVLDLLRAAFPGGSITGAPKIRAMQIIDELEPVARGIYTGAIGYLGFAGDMELNIAIRTTVIKDGIAYFGVGGGIVADSQPVPEYEETLHKGAAIARVLLAESA